MFQSQSQRSPTRAPLNRGPPWHPKTTASGLPGPLWHPQATASGLPGPPRHPKPKTSGLPRILGWGGVGWARPSREPTTILTLFFDKSQKRPESGRHGTPRAENPWNRILPAALTLWDHFRNLIFSFVFFEFWPGLWLGRPVGASQGNTLDAAQALQRNAP